MNTTPPENPNSGQSTPEPPVLPRSNDASSPETEFSEADQVPVTGYFGSVDAILRNPKRILFQLQRGNSRETILLLIGVAIVCALGYGLIVGLFSGGEQVFLAPVKIAAGLLLSALICLPSLYIFAALGGSKAGIADVLGLLAGLLALTTILLIGFAPVAWIFSESTESVAMMGALHLAFWFVAVGFGLKFLHTGFRHTSLRGNEGVSVWTIIFVAVALQMTTALRPILGTADTMLPQEKKFFLAHWADNMNDGAGSGRKTANRY
jgi:hypothetical protein